VSQQIVCSAINGFLRHNMIARTAERLKGHGNGSGAGGHGKGGCAAFQGGHALFQHFSGGIGEARINIAGVGQIEAGCGMGGIVENIGGSLVNWGRASSRSWVWLLLSGMDL